LRRFDRDDREPRHRQAELRRSLFRGPALLVRAGMLWPREDADALDARQRFPEEFDPLADELAREIADAGEAGVGTRQALYQLRFDRIAAEAEHYRHALREAQHGERAELVRHDDFRLALDDLAHHLLEVVG